MFCWLKRHPFPIKAFFRHSLVLTYAFPESLLEPLMPPGLVLDTYEGFGFVAIAMVQTQRLRPVFAPRALGQDFFLTGYRIFARFEPAEGRKLRGLRILRSDVNRRLMVWVGNLLTHYKYRKASVVLREGGETLHIKIETPGAEADLRVIADLASRPAPLPNGSPFRDARDARRCDIERPGGRLLRQIVGVAGAARPDADLVVRVDLRRRPRVRVRRRP